MNRKIVARIAFRERADSCTGVDAGSMVTTPAWARQAERAICQPKNRRGRQRTAKNADIAHKPMGTSSGLSTVPVPPGFVILPLQTSASVVASGQHRHVWFLLRRPACAELAAWHRIKRDHHIESS